MPVDLVFQQHEVLVSEAGDHVHLAAVVMQPFRLRKRDSRAQAAADDARALRTCELGGVPQRPGEIEQRVARLHLGETHGGGAHRLEDDRDGAGLRVAVVHGERDALALLVDAQHDELTGLDLFRDLGSTHHHARHLGIERLYLFDGIHVFALLVSDTKAAPKAVPSRRCYRQYSKGVPAPLFQACFHPASGGNPTGRVLAAPRQASTIPLRAAPGAGWGNAAW